MNILKAQWPIDEKLEYSDFVIHNEGTLEDTRRQVEKVWEELKKGLKCAKVPRMPKVREKKRSEFRRQ